MSQHSYQCTHTRAQKSGLIIHTGLVKNSWKIPHTEYTDIQYELIACTNVWFDLILKMFKYNSRSLQLEKYPTQSIELSRSK